MRALTWVTVVVVVAFGMMGCAQKREELPQVEPADLQATAPTEKPAVIETPPPAPVPARVERPVLPKPLVERPVVEKPAAASTYTVKKGDTLSSIARSVYGEAMWRKIFEANRDKIQDPDKLKIGTVLTIPPK